MSQTTEPNDIPAGENHAQTIAALAQRAGGWHFVGEIPTIALPNDARVHALESFLPAPTRIRQTSAFTDVRSFVFFVNRFKLSATLLFA